ncbi:MAG: RNA 2',3'-cyclic phosphodiesterase, partial [Desulfovibrionaceae bacterium]
RGPGRAAGPGAGRLMGGRLRLFVALALPEAYQRGLAEVEAALRPVLTGGGSGSGAGSGGRGPGPRLTWTRPGVWHLTLKFLGDVPERGPAAEVPAGAAGGSAAGSADASAGGSAAGSVGGSAAGASSPARPGIAAAEADAEAVASAAPAAVVDVAAVRAALARVRFAPFILQAGGGGVFPDLRRPRVLWTGLVRGAEPVVALATAIQAELTPLGFAPEPRPFAPHLTLARVKDPHGAPGRADWPAVLRRLDARTWPEAAVTEFALYRSELTPAGPIHTRLAAFPAAPGA